MRSAINKRIIVSVTNDLVCDNRVNKVCTTLCNMGFDVLLIGRRLSKSPPFHPQGYKILRFKMLSNKGFFFYAFYNIRLFCYLLFSRFDILLSNDLDTLVANFFVSKIKNKPLVYDSHEYFTEVPELINRPAVQHTWEWLERKMVPRLKYAYTVCNSIARIYHKKYGTCFRVVRNLPVARSFPVDKRNDFSSIPKMILYQGAVNAGRGLRQAILAMKLIEGAQLVIAGDGDIKSGLEKLVEEENLNSKVRFLGRLTIEELAKLTPCAAIGLSIEEDLGLNYHYALPNKLFDYIQALVPVVVSDLPEMAAVIRHYQVGMVTPSLQTEKLAGVLKVMLHNLESRDRWFHNLRIAAKELTWEREEKIVMEIFQPLL